MRGIFSLLPDCTPPSGTDWKADGRNARPFVANSKAANALAAAIFGPKCIGIDDRVFGKTTRDADWIPAANALYETVQGPWGCAALVIGSNRRDEDMPSREQLAGWVQQVEMPLIVEEVDRSTEIGRCVIDGTEHPLFAFLGFRFVLHDGTLSGVIYLPQGYNPPEGIFATPAQATAPTDGTATVRAILDGYAADRLLGAEEPPTPTEVAAQVAPLVGQLHGHILTLRADPRFTAGDLVGMQDELVAWMAERLTGDGTADRVMVRRMADIAFLHGFFMTAKEG